MVSSAHSGLSFYFCFCWCLSPRDNLFTPIRTEVAAAADRGARGPATPTPRGRPPAPPPEGTPSLGGTGSRTPCGNRGAPARGVDVKPSPGPGPGEPRGGSKPPKLPKMGIFGQNQRFWAFSPKSGLFGRFPGFQTLRRGGFYINPSRRTPRSSPEGPPRPRGPGPLPGLPGAHPRPVQGLKDRTACAGRAGRRLGIRW